MFFKVCFSIGILLLVTFSTFAQSAASASISAEISTLVGAETISAMSFNYNRNSASGIILEPSETRRHQAVLPSSGSDNTFAASIKIFGTSQLFDVQLQNEPVILEDESGNEKCRIQAFKLEKMSSGDLGNYTTFSICATINYNPLVVISRSLHPSFNLMVNFN